MNLLVTGGAGFIGTHTLIELYKAGHTAVVVDNLSNSNPVALQRVEEIVNSDNQATKQSSSPAIPFYKVDIRDREGLEEVFKTHKFDACIHFAGLKAVGESVEKPWEYYDNNIGGTLVLVDVMRKHGCKNIIFSSSATVYGDPEEIPITESCPKGQCTNPYGWTKSMLEQILMDIQKADAEWKVVLLRYFNPVGAHPSGRIGENPNGIPNNLMPYITQVAVGKRKELGVFGDDYDTPDGTGVRDYIHVCDLAAAHVAALQCFAKNTESEIQNPPKPINLSTYQRQTNQPINQSTSNLSTNQHQTYQHINQSTSNLSTYQHQAYQHINVKPINLSTSNPTQFTGHRSQVTSYQSPIPTHQSLFVYNLGTGHGYSVLDMVKAFVKVNGVDVPYSIKPRRAGDIATCYCNPEKAKDELGWQAKYGIEDMVRDSWNWQKNNPNGYPPQSE